MEKMLVEYLQIMHVRYQDASRQERSFKLDEVQSVHPFHGKYLIRFFGAPLKKGRFTISNG